MMTRITFVLSLVASLLLLATTTTGQSLLESDLFVADRGNMNDGSDGAVHRFNYDGSFVSTLPSGGNGQVRGIDIAADGTIYVARGNEIIRFTSPGLTPDALPFATGTKAQNVAVHPTTGNVWCSFGANSGEAMLIEVDPTGIVLQTLGGSPFEQPRGLAFDASGDVLYVANVTGQNVLAVDTTVNPATVTVHASTSGQGGGSFTPIGIAYDPAEESPTLYLTGDFMTTDEILRVVGVTGSTTITTALDYTMNTALNAPSGLRADSWGNLRIACRNRDSSTPGIYTFRRDSGNQSLSPSTGSPILNPVDVAFLRRPFSVTVTSDQNGDVFESNGVASVLIGGDLQPTVRVVVDAPDYPNSPYVVLFSLLSQGQCANGDPVRPQGGGQTLVVGDPRRTPLENDTLLATSQQLLFTEINQGGPTTWNIDPGLNCPISTPGSTLFLFGLTDAMGQGQAFLTLPSFPDVCFPFDFAADMGFSAAVLDSITGPLGIGLASAAPECLRLFRFTN